MTSFPDMVRVDCEFGEDLLGYIQDYRMGLLVVRLDLDESHPAMQDVIADGHDPSQAEIICMVPLTQVKAERGSPGCTCGVPPFAPPEPSEDCPFHGDPA